MIIDISEDGRTIEWWSNGERKIATIYQLIDAYDGIVRCKDCKFWNRYYDVQVIGSCSRHGCIYTKREIDFCSWGERKDGEENG